MYDLHKDDDYFTSVLPELLKTSRGKFVLLHDCENQGIYDTREEALKASVGRFIPGEFLVKEIIEDDGMPKFFSFRFAFV